MKFSELDARMRVFEEAGDVSVIPGLYMVVRLDGRSFTRLTREIKQYEAPFDRVFHEAMATTTEHCMKCGFMAVLGYTQSDEISLLLHPEDTSFDRKERKILSVLAGEASACFSVQVGVPAAFDARICPLPNEEAVIDYFRWRSDDASRNALNSWCYWTLRKRGLTVKEATAHLQNMSVAKKNQLLFEQNINFNDLPSWQKRGTAVFFERCEVLRTNRLTGEKVPTSRRIVRHESDLPIGDAFGKWAEKFLGNGS